MRALLYFILALLFSCQSRPEKKVLRVATASNAQYAIREIAKTYMQNHEIEIEVISASSGKLTAQITQGAPYDLFIAADLSYPTSLFEKKMSEKKPKIYALGQLVLWTMDDQLVLHDSIFCSDQFEYFTIANPKIAPYGKASIEVMQYYDCKPANTKLILGENLAQCSQLIRQATVPFGFSAAAIVNSPINKNVGHWILLPEYTYQPIQQAAIVLKRSQHPHRKDFFNYLFSPKAQKILRNYAYRIPE